MPKAVVAARHERYQFANTEGLAYALRNLVKLRAHEFLFAKEPRVLLNDWKVLVGKNKAVPASNTRVRKDKETIGKVTVHIGARKPL
jgi:hypothetical protein